MLMGACSRSQLPEQCHIQGQSEKIPNIWNSAPVSRRRTLATVVLCSWDFKLYFDTSHITPLSICHAALSERVFSAPGEFLQVEEWRILKSNVFAWNSLSKTGKNLYGDFSDVATGLWGGLFEPYAMLRVVSAFQIGQNVHRRWSQIWTAFFANGRPSHWESAFCDTWKSSSNYPWSFRRSRHL